MNDEQWAMSDELVPVDSTVPGPVSVPDRVPVPVRWIGRLLLIVSVPVFGHWSSSTYRVCSRCCSRSRLLFLRPLALSLALLLLELELGDDNDCFVFVSDKPISSWSLIPPPCRRPGRGTGPAELDGDEEDEDAASFK